MCPVSGKTPTDQDEVVMKRSQANAAPPTVSPVIGDFFPLTALYAESAPGAMFPSEQSARWFLRQNRPALAEAKAIAIHAGRMLVNPERVRDVAVRVAINAAQVKVPR